MATRIKATDGYIALISTINANIDELETAIEKYDLDTTLCVGWYDTIANLKASRISWSNGCWGAYGQSSGSGSIMVICYYNGSWTAVGTLSEGISSDFYVAEEIDAVESILPYYTSSDESAGLVDNTVSVPYEADSAYGLDTCDSSCRQEAIMYSSDVDWLTPLEVDDGNLSVKIEANDTTDSRSGNITVWSRYNSSAKDTCTIVQAGAVIEVTFSAVDSSVSIVQQVTNSSCGITSNSTGYLDLDIETPYDWTLDWDNESGEGWIKFASADVDQVTGTGNSTATFEMTANSTSAYRNKALVFASGDETYNITIVQFPVVS